ncbi:MAG: MFS transporter [Woeseiaceae bacterium]
MIDGRSALLPIVLITIGAVLGLAATDLVLPAIPILPDVVTGSAASAQWVLAGFALGTGVGLLIFGALGTKFRLIDILIVSLLAFAVLSFVAAHVETLVAMSSVRFLQGVSASASAVYAPVMIKQLYEGPAAIAMIGRLGSIESIAPAIAPIIGLFLLNSYGWQSSFYVVAAVAAILAIAWYAAPGMHGRFGRLTPVAGGYLELLKNPQFLRYALSQAGTLGALLVIVFSAPKVITSSMGGELSDFIIMQVSGIVFFIIAANMAGIFSRVWGAEKTIFIGSLVSALGCIAIWFMSFINAQTIPLLWLFFVFVNLGLGIRGPVGFYQALLASGHDDSRGSAMIILLVMLTAAAGTGIVAPYIEQGLLPVALGAMILAAASVVLLLLLAPFREAEVSKSGNNR